MTPGIIAVDPGGTETGIVLRRGDDLLAHWTVKESDPVVHINAVLTYLTEAYKLDPVADFAVEDVTPPNPHMGMTSVKGIIGTARTLGACIGWWASYVILVPPGGNGSGPLAAYPPALRPTRGAGRGKDGLRHCRSAWDVAGAAQTLLRQRRAS